MSLSSFSSINERKYSFNVDVLILNNDKYDLLEFINVSNITIDSLRNCVPFNMKYTFC